jgi:hypothetical protein
MAVRTTAITARSSGLGAAGRTAHRPTGHGRGCGRRGSGSAVRWRPSSGSRPGRRAPEATPGQGRRGPSSWRPGRAEATPRAPPSRGPEATSLSGRRERQLTPMPTPGRRCRGCVRSVAGQRDECRFGWCAAGLTTLGGFLCSAGNDDAPISRRPALGPSPRSLRRPGCSAARHVRGTASESVESHTGHRV